MKTKVKYVLFTSVLIALSILIYFNIERKQILHVTIMNTLQEYLMISVDIDGEEVFKDKVVNDVFNENERFKVKEFETNSGYHDIQVSINGGQKFDTTIFILFKDNIVINVSDNCTLINEIKSCEDEIIQPHIQNFYSKEVYWEL